MYDIRKHVLDVYNSNSAQEFYKKEALKGLWNSENILINKYFKSNSSVLDIGCGTGRTTIPLFKMGYQVVGIDFTPTMIENAKIISSQLALNIQYQIGDATNISFPGNSFENAIFSYNGWCQIPSRNERLKAFQEIYRILKPDGYFIFSAIMRESYRKPKYILVWIAQWIKVNILKYIGIKVLESEFGDIFLQPNDYDYDRQKQFVHLPSFNEVEGLLKESKFQVVYCNNINLIAENEVSQRNCTFFVCQK